MWNSFIFTLSINLSVCVCPATQASLSDHYDIFTVFHLSVSKTSSQPSPSLSILNLLQPKLSAIASTPSPEDSPQVSSANCLPSPYPSISLQLSTLSSPTQTLDCSLSSLTLSHLIPSHTPTFSPKTPPLLLLLLPHSIYVSLLNPLKPI